MDVGRSSIESIMVLASVPAEVLLAIAFLVLIATVLVSRHWRNKRMSTLGTFGDSRTESHVRTDLQQLLIQIQEISREQIAKADSKIRMLHQLLAECEQMRRELETLLGRTAARSPASRPNNPLHEKVFTLQDEGKDAQTISGETGLEIGEVEMILGLRKL